MLGYEEYVPMELRHLRYFVVVAEQLNLTRAAELLHTSQPSLGRQIQQLEDMVQFKLFERKQHRLQLTEAGKLFLTDVRRILGDLNSSVFRARAAASGIGEPIVIAYIAPAAASVLPTLLPMVQHLHPDLKPQVRLLTVTQQVNAILDGSVDIGFLRGPIDHEQLHWEVLLKEQLYAILPAVHPLAKKRSVRLSDITDLPFVEVSQQFLAVLQNLFPDVDFLSSRAVGAGDRDNLIDQLAFIGAGLGYTVLTGSVREFAPATVAVKPIAAASLPEIDLLFACRKDNPSVVLGKFLNVLRRWKEMQSQKKRT